MAGLKQWVIDAFVATDVWLNVHLLGGKPGETITQHAARAAKEYKVWGCVLCRLLDLVDKGHCRRFGKPSD